MLFAGLTKRKRPVVVWSDTEINEAIGTSLTNTAKPYYTKGKMVAYFGNSSAQLPSGYHWDGATIPRLCWTLLGIAPSDPRSLVASAFHDAGCENPNTPQVVADAMFVALLRPIRFNNRRIKGVGWTRATLMYMAVRAYSIFGRPVYRCLKR
jgi:hypothetical protein